MPFSGLNKNIYFDSFNYNTMKNTCDKKTNDIHSNKVGRKLIIRNELILTLICLQKLVEFIHFSNFDIFFASLR